MPSAPEQLQKLFNREPGVFIKLSIFNLKCMKSHCLLTLNLAFLLLPAFLFSQKEPMKFGKVPQEDIALKVYEPDTSAAAVVLGDYGNLKFIFRENDVTYTFYRHRRIKIFNRAGFDQGDIEIPFYSKKGMEDVKSIKAVIITPDGTVTDVSKKEIFEEQVNEYFSRKRFTIPNLTEGCIIDYEYETTCKNIFTLPEWYFQEDIPVRWSEIRMEVPEWYNYTLIRQGRQLDVSEQDIVRENFYVSGGISNGGNMAVNVSKNRYIMKEVPALKEESFITTMDDYYARMRFQLSTITYPNAAVKNIMNSWEEVAKELWNDNGFGWQLKRKKNYDAAWIAVQPLLREGLSPVEKCQVIYDFVLANVNPEPGRSVRVRNDLNDCFRKKKGLNSEINLLLVALLREAGIAAYPMLVSNRDHGKVLPLYPLIDQFDNVLAYVKLDQESLILDATSPFRPMGYPSENALNMAGWVVSEENPEWIRLNPPAASDTYLLNFALSVEGEMNGSVKFSSTGYSAVELREQMADSPDGAYFTKKISERFPDARIDSMIFDGKALTDKAFKAMVKCRLPAMATISGDLIYLAPALMSSFTENPFKLEERTYPVDIPYPLQERLILNLTLPDGYSVEELPESVRMALPGDGGKFNFQMSQRENTLQLISNLQIDQLHFEPEEYAVLRTFMDLVAQKLAEQLVLKRV